MRFSLMLGCGLVWLGTFAAVRAEGERADWTVLESQFRTLPMEAKRLTGPLFWLHGDESKDRLEMYLEKVAESGNGCFTAESRPHKDWLGPTWYRDLDICLEQAKKLNLQMWIFDEKWWPSQMIGGKVPPQYGSKTMVAEAIGVKGPKAISEAGYGGGQIIGVVAGREADGAIDGASLVDLAPFIKDGTLNWNAPEGNWKVMKFSWAFTGPKGMQQKMIAVDGASKECVDWFIQTVYQPHYDRFKDDFGKTIRGYFYDEPETLGDWGPEVMPMLAERKVDWKKALVAWKFRLAGEEQVAARYQYADAFAEAWGRTMYGGMSTWCRERNVVSMGHFMEHGTDLYSTRLCAGNIFQLQKYSDMGGIDLVCQQFYPGQKKEGLWQMARIGSSIAHVYGKKDDLAMCEMFGAYGQNITYPEMKWLTDQMQVRGINFMIPHSFNPRAPYDTDCPPFFYNGGYEPRYPLHRVYCDYTSRLSLLLSGGRHVAPVAFLFLGQSYHAGQKIRPDGMSNALDDALFDCDWMPYDAFAEARIEGKELALHRERYRVLVVPAAEVLPYETLAKVKGFYDAGGIVVGYGILPGKSATLGKTSADMKSLSTAIWGDDPKPSTKALATSAKGGRAYFLPATASPEDIQAALTADAGVHPAVEVLEGKTDRWLHVLHRVKAGRDVFLIANQNHTGQARPFRFKVTADGEPEVWDPMRNLTTVVPFKRIDPRTIELALTLEPSESVLLVFGDGKRALPARIGPDTKSLRDPVAIVRDPTPAQMIVPSAPPQEPAAPVSSKRAFDDCNWVWYPEANPAQAAAPGTRYFRGQLAIPAGRKIKSASFIGTCDNQLTLFVNGNEAGKSSDDSEGWRSPTTIDLTRLLADGANTLAIAATNFLDAPNPAGLIGKIEVAFESGPPITAAIDAAWKSCDKEQPNWNQVSFDDKAWPAAKAIGAYGIKPWGRFAEQSVRRTRLTPSPVKSDPFVGHCDLPADVDPTRCRVFVEMDAPSPEAAAHVTVNGQYAGGFIGAPCRVEVTGKLKPGTNHIVIVPFAPKQARLVVYP